MNIRQAEDIMFDAVSSNPKWPQLHSKAFGWADRKKHDMKVSADLRRRASIVAKTIWESKGKK